MKTLTQAVALMLALSGCRGESDEVEFTAAPASQPEARPTQLNGISEEKSNISIVFVEGGKERELYGEPRDNGKRKYTLDDGPVLFEIKPGDDQGFKLRNPDGSLRWKVKVYPDKIKISDNEQNERPHLLRRHGMTRASVVTADGREPGEVRMGAQTSDVVTTDGRVIFSRRGPSPSAGMGVLLIDSIPARERYILAAELMSRGQ